MGEGNVKRFLICQTHESCPFLSIQCRFWSIRSHNSFLTIASCPVFGLCVRARELVSLFYDIGFPCFYFYFHIIAVNCVLCKRFSDGVVLAFFLLNPLSKCKIAQPKFSQSTPPYGWFSLSLQQSRLQLKANGKAVTECMRTIIKCSWPMI